MAFDAHMLDQEYLSKGTAAAPKGPTVGGMGVGPSGTQLLHLRAFALRSVGLLAGSLGVLLGFTRVLLTLCVVILAMLLGCGAMRLRCTLVLLGRLGVCLLCHCSIFLLAGDSRRTHKLRQSCQRGVRGWEKKNDLVGTRARRACDAAR
jgi:hypothetical protein